VAKRGSDFVARFCLSLIVSLICGAAIAWADEPTTEELQLLTMFRREFVEVTPAKGAFPPDFLMGRADGEDPSRPVHRVHFRCGFAIARYEVPQNLWTALMGRNPSRWQGPRNAVEMLSFDDAVDFCNHATSRLRAARLIEANQIVRLPSEAEWEYAARAGTTTRYSFGDDVAQLNAHAWSTRNAAGNDPPVGALGGNPWGLHDVHGYLWEWCADAWHDSYEGSPSDGSAWTSGGDPMRRVLRGGSWKDTAEKLTSSYRRAAPRGLADDAVGLRCVLSEERRP
jgi:formylglycine-generating enzyme required for sulfatase activity